MSTTTVLTAANFKGEMKAVDIDDIIADRDLQPREDLDTMRKFVEDVAEAVKKGEEIDPIFLMDVRQSDPPEIKRIDGKPVKPGLYVVEGNRRLLGYKAAGRKKIPAIVRIGTYQEAVDVASSANVGNLALPRTKEDKKRAVLMSLINRFDHSDRFHAEHCKVSQELVKKTRPLAEKLLPAEAKGKVDASGKPVRVSKSGKVQAAKKTKTKANPEKKLADWVGWESRFGWMIRFMDHLIELNGSLKGSLPTKALDALKAHGKIAMKIRDKSQEPAK